MSTTADDPSSDLRGHDHRRRRTRGARLVVWYRHHDGIGIAQRRLPRELPPRPRPPTLDTLAQVHDRPCTVQRSGGPLTVEMTKWHGTPSDVGRIATREQARLENLGAHGQRHFRAGRLTSGR